jgi:hypothetical protein
VLGDQRATMHKIGTCDTCRTAWARQAQADKRTERVDGERIAIEQAIARGLGNARIMADLGVDYETVWDVRRHMDEVAG